MKHVCMEIFMQPADMDSTESAEVPLFQCIKNLKTLPNTIQIKHAKSITEMLSFTYNYTICILSNDTSMML